jgi:hypothetical protein
MDILPLLFCLVIPILWTAAVFAIGRWSAGHTISIQRRGELPAKSSPYYDKFEEA